MFFVASKILVWFIFPLSVGLLLLILAYGAVLLRKKASFHGLFLFAVFLLYVFSIQPVADFLLEPLERKHLSTNQTDLKADAIVVLSGDVKRVIKAIRLFKHGAAPIMIMAGGSGDLFDQTLKEAVLMKDFAVEFDVPEKKILIETQSRNTRENVLSTKDLLDKIKAKRVILVTSAFHMPRSYALFKKAGIDAIPAPSEFYASSAEYDPFSFIPKARSLALSSVAIKEYVAILVYWLLGWI